ncbi:MULTISPECIES: hypothetical protein [Nocardia]|uniref:hypothetical protein n=1 Tax=Nocardia TaxID=1817 RepID=UPI000BF22E3D|nr:MULTISPECIES: hypothetical protein [Nocardia]MBF6184576.1 hypothetical protein [Nocardia farcinica]MBF6310420.1 hypothetical protein [Nocardia farcinica]MBF6405761.1 hypothetical protein [Nocardia farcinica]PEH75414.1 hypothetical protein CRM89_04895 [Nocardia sp. FDAARGOS_372]UEX24980.1 hypothetical protein LMJ57_11170 [Nocardia farcinica]
MRAPAAVARTPRADAAVDRLVWSLVITGEYDVVVGWERGRGIGEFGIGHGLTMDAGYGAAAVWVADVVQGRLAGREFVQWPSSGLFPLLVPRLVGSAPVWVDPHTGATIAPRRTVCARRPVARRATVPPCPAAGGGAGVIP